MAVARSGFAAKEVALEGIRGVIARRSRVFIFGVGVAFVSSLVCAISFTDISRIENQWREQVYAGSNVLSITAANAEDGGTLDGHRCDAMRSISGVRSAGAILRITEAFAMASPNARLSLVDTTPGYLAIAYPRDQRAEKATVIAGASVVNRLGVVDDGTFAYRLREVNQSFFIDVDVATSTAARREPFDNAVMRAVGGNAATYECLVEAEPGAIEALVSASQMWFAPTEVRVSPELPGNDLVADPQAALRERFSQWLPLATGGALLVVLLVTWWARRADYASYRAFGLRKPQLALLLAAETALAFWLPIVLGFSAVSIALAPLVTSMSAHLLVNDYVSLLLVASLAPILGAWLLSGRSAFEVAKGR